MLSSLYGSYNVESLHPIPPDTIATFFCPHCHAQLIGGAKCGECAAPMVPMIVRGGGIVQLTDGRSYTWISHAWQADWHWVTTAGEMLLRFTYSGFVGGDGTGDLTTQPVCSVAGAYTNVGIYPIICSGGIDENYAYSYLPGTLTISKRTLTVSASDKSKTYGDFDPAFSFTEAETLPDKRRKDLESFGFALICAPEDGGKLHVQRDLVIKKTYFPLEQYKTVKAFFDEVTAGDEELVVLSAVKK